jgi:hypothetical protein
MYKGQCTCTSMRAQHTCSSSSSSSSSSSTGSSSSCDSSSSSSSRATISLPQCVCVHSFSFFGALSTVWDLHAGAGSNRGVHSAAGKIQRALCASRDATAVCLHEYVQFFSALQQHWYTLNLGSFI